MRGIYTGLFDRIEQARYHVFDKRIRVPTASRFIIAAGIWLRSRFA